jgi:hypothetical protein
MKITEKHLRRIISEEISNVIQEYSVQKPMPNMAAVMVKSDAPDADSGITIFGGTDGDTDWYNLLFDVGGFIPGIGEIFDALNAADYIRKKNYLLAGLSLISVIPVIGDALGKGGKTIVWISKLNKLKKNFEIIKWMATAGKTIRYLIKNNDGKIRELFDYIAQSNASSEIKRSLPDIKKSLDDFANLPDDISDTGSMATLSPHAPVTDMSTPGADAMGRGGQPWVTEYSQKLTDLV